MDFGIALAALRQGKCVMRQGWNGKGMWLELWTPGVELPAEATGKRERVQPRPVDPCIVMKTVGGTLQPGWLASQADMLATDWVVL